MLRRRAPWIVLCFVVFAGSAYAFSKEQTKKYTATASLVFNNNQQALQVAGLQPAGSNETQQALQSTNLKLVELGDMSEATAARLGDGLTRQKIDNAISVSAQGESNIINVAATATSPILAADIANTYTTLFVSEQQNSNHAYYASALRLVERQLAALSPKQKQSAAAAALQSRAQSLGVLAELRNSGVSVAQPASVPTSPSSPTTSRNTALGAVLGLLLGLGVAFLLERLDRRIREPEDLQRIYQSPLLGVISESRALARISKGNGPASAPPLSEDAEAFQLIRAHLRYFNVDREIHTLMISSAAPGDGKTTIASHLAAAAARMGSRVLLLEVDLRRPTLATQLGVQAWPGLADVLIGAATLAGAAHAVELGISASAGDRERALDVLVAGAVLPPNPGELIESRAMTSLLAQAQQTYDLVVIDTPPLTAVSDAFPLLGKVDGLVLVGRIGQNRRDVAERLHEILKGADAPLLGVIANGFKARHFGAYGYSYGYPRDSHHPDAAAVDPAGNGATALEQEQHTARR